jgi:hypothetical protein
LRLRGRPRASLQAKAGDDRKVVGCGLVAAGGRVLGDRGRFARAGVDPLDLLHERLADEDAINELAAAAEHAAKATVRWDQRREVPQPRAVALVGPLEAAGADLSAGAARAGSATFGTTSSPTTSAGAFGC